MKQHLWKDNGICFDTDTNLYFEKYEDEADIRSGIDSMCKMCPVKKTCFANGISGKEWGVWGGVYLEGGEISIFDGGASSGCYSDCSFRGSESWNGYGAYSRGSNQ